MTRVQLAVFPAIFLGIFAVLMITKAIANPQAVISAAQIQELSGGGSLAETGSGGADPVQPLAEVFQPPTRRGLITPAIAENGIPVVEPVFLNVPEPINAAGCSIHSGYGDNILQWCSLIEKYAFENNLDPELIAALITQESNGDANAYSHSGAVGLMQVMPRDGLAENFMCPAGPCFADRPTITELNDPEFNISYGTKMLASLIQKYGDVREALKSYGPMNVDYYYADIVLGIYNSKIQ